MTERTMAGNPRQPASNSRRKTQTTLTTGSDGCVLITKNIIHGSQQEYVSAPSRPRVETSCFTNPRDDTITAILPVRTVPDWKRILIAAQAVSLNHYEWKVPCTRPPEDFHSMYKAL